MIGWGQSWTLDRALTVWCDAMLLFLSVTEIAVSKEWHDLYGLRNENAVGV